MQNAQVNFKLQRMVTVVAVLLFAIKMLAWWLTRSVSILTDALESTVNVVAGFISLYSLYVASKPKDEDHPYGHGKAEFVSAAFEGSMIAIAGVIIIYESIKNLVSPGELKSLDSGIILVSITAAVNFFVGWRCVKTGQKNNSLALIASGKHLQSDTYSTIGIVAGLILIYFTGWNKLDSILAMGFAFFIMYTGYTIIRSSIEGIMDKADVELLKKLVVYLNKHRRENWIDFHNVRIIKFGSTLHLDAHLTVPWYLNVHEAHMEVEELSRLIRNEFGESLEMFIHTDGCLDFSCNICNKSDCNVRQHSFKNRVEWTVENIISDKKHELDREIVR
ncbi:MAG TPA: cation diffusion facilitator family transporter, partial [Chitinophagaceae bacterium]|nr:cation diffusion facilitator family transporter [Chitinophagaceae bacterium]